MAEMIEFIVHNDVKELERLSRDVHRRLESRGLPDRVIYAANLALEEILTNIAKYAYRDDLLHEIAVRIEVGDRDVTIFCEDDGRPFDPLSAPAPDLSGPILERKAGGVGLRLVRDMVDYIGYRREQDRNILEIVVKEPSSGRARGSGE